MYGDGQTKKSPGPVTVDAGDLLSTERRPIMPEVEKRVLRKIDTFLMPAMVIGTNQNMAFMLDLVQTPSRLADLQQDMGWFIMTR